MDGKQATTPPAPLVGCYKKPLVKNPPSSLPKNPRWGEVGGCPQFRYFQAAKGAKPGGKMTKIFSNQRGAENLVFTPHGPPILFFIGEFLFFFSPPRAKKNPPP
eukprot:FR735405.1.p3 GENE.FR735405.1~~FR735405.1.p3  ORF type:complete len:104 (+),score=42.99 FR735405.1:829-1140(+)